MEERFLSEFGFVNTKKTVHASEYTKGNTVIYVIPVATLNIVVGPSNEQWLISEEIEFKLYHNSNMNKFPKRNNGGINEIYYGLKIEFEDWNDFSRFFVRHENVLM